MNNKNPLVSFVIPTHNRANVLRDCLESVVNQTYKNIEVVVVNDNSTDQTLKILGEYKNKYDFFRFYNNDGKGVSAARNLGIKIAKGDYIAFMDDDDICELFRIEEQMKPILNINFVCNFVISSFSIVSSAGKILHVYDYLLKTDSIGFTVRWLVKKDLLLQTGGFDLEQPNLEEVELFFRLKEITKIYFSTIPVVKVRESRVSLTKDDNKMICGIKRLLELHSDKMDWYEKNSWLITLCRKYIESSSWKEFVNYFPKIEKGRFRIHKLAVILSYKTKSLLPLKIYDILYSKMESYINRKNKVYSINHN